MDDPLLGLINWGQGILPDPNPILPEELSNISEIVDNVWLILCMINVWLSFFPSFLVAFTESLRKSTVVNLNKFFGSFQHEMKDNKNHSLFINP